MLINRWRGSNQGFGTKPQQNIIQIFIPKMHIASPFTDYSTNKYINQYKSY